MQHARIVTNPKSILILAGTLSACMAGAAAAQPIFVGDMDNFGDSYDNADTLITRPAFEQYLARASGMNQALHEGQRMPFDTESPNWFFGYSFMNLPTLYEGATLEIRIKGISGLSINDNIALQFTGDAETFGALWHEGIGETLGESWNSGDIATLTLNLGDLPGGVNLINAINADGYLDVFMQDDTSVDWMRLTVPAPGTASLIALGGVMAMRRRR